MAARPADDEASGVLMAVLLFFIDGLGVGADDPQINPCAGRGLQYFGFTRGGTSSALPCGGVFRAADANLGVAGLPQSATGQTTLFTGINAARLLGRHLPGFPNQQLRQVLREHSLLRRISGIGLKPMFINTFRPLFFALPASSRWKMSASTCAALAADIDFCTIDNIAAGRTLYHDFSNCGLIRRGFDVPRFTPQKAGDVLAGALDESDFILYEYFLTDRAGHARAMDRAVSILHDLDALLDQLLARADLSRDTIIVTSDHGNIEDLSVKPHTRNPVPVLVWGPGGESAASVRSIADIAPLILNIMRPVPEERQACRE